VDIHADNDDAVLCACFYGHVRVGRWLVALDPAWDWPLDAIKALQDWSPPRDAWMRAVLAFRGPACRAVQ
jgi:hypothetical protein